MATAGAGHLFGQVQYQLPAAAEAPSDRLSSQLSTPAPHTRAAPESSPTPRTLPKPGAQRCKARGLYKLSKPHSLRQQKQAFALLHLLIKSSLNLSGCLIRRLEPPKAVSSRIQGSFSLVSCVTRTAEGASPRDRQRLHSDLAACLALTAATFYTSGCI